MLYGSGRDGSPQIYAGDPARPGDPPLALTVGPERAIWARYTPDGKYVLFLRDSQGDENHHVWRVGADGGAPVDLTPGEPLVRHEPWLPRDRPDVFVYGASKRTERTTRVYVQSVAGGPPRLAYTHAQHGGLSDVAPDGTRALFGEVHSWADVIISELDLAAGTLRRVYPPEGKSVAVYNATYSPDGARIYVTTDEGGESWSLLAFAAATGEELARYTSPGPLGATLNVLPSPLGDRLVVQLDAGNHGELRVLDARTLALARTIEVPLGDVQLGTFRPDGREFAIMISLPDRPPDIYAVDPEKGDIRPLRADPRPGLDSLGEVTATLAEVKAHDGLTIPLNVYLPASGPDAPAIRRPTIVIFHGGPMASSAIRWDPFVRFFLALGYAVLEPNVRGSTGFGRAFELADNREKRLDWLEDLASVNAWTRAQPWCDPARIAVWGASYGGYTTLMALSRQPTLWRAGVDLFGPADLASFLRSHKVDENHGLVFEWGHPDKDAAMLADLSPIRDVEKIVAPLFVYAGENDPRVPRSESDTIVRALRARQVPVEYMVAADEGHTFDRRETKLELLTRMARFLADAMPPP